MKLMKDDCRLIESADLDEALGELGKEAEWDKGFVRGFMFGVLLGVLAVIFVVATA